MNVCMLLRRVPSGGRYSLERCLFVCLFVYLYDNWTTCEL